MKGLKQMVEDAERPAPVAVSDEAQRALAFKMREWSGWADATLVLGKPRVSPYAECDHNKHQFTANPDALVLNPNRVVLTVTPFRLKQEAVFTGALLHEAGHARYSKWQPRTPEAVAAFCHSDGSKVSAATMALARVMEEPRIEGLIARDSGRIGALGLDWTMRAASAHLLPMTALAADPDQKILDLITSWALRAGRQIALNHHTGFQIRPWAGQFTTLMGTTVYEHLVDKDSVDPSGDQNRIASLLIDMITWVEGAVHRAFMVDAAREVLTLLFPETPEDEQPEAGEGCSGQQGQSEKGEKGEKSEQQEPGAEGDSKAGADGDGETEGDAEGDAPEDMDSDADSGEGGATPSTGEDEGEAESSDEGDPSEDAEPERGDGEAETDTESELAKALRSMEEQAKSETEEDADEQSQQTGGSAGGHGGGGDMGEGWRTPNKREREIQKGAERFLRGLIAPTEASKVTLTEAPSAMVDGAALAAWKAGGMIRDPKFFRRTRREVEPSPPVKIAVLVDVSGSMEELQKPSAILSWALASAALDLRNFAGRGQQIESTLIHWGSDARVIQKNGQMLPGIREVPCIEGTSAMAEALDLVAEQLPGFFEVGDKPTHRLLVQFTDWELTGWGSAREAARGRVHKALMSGVNMVTVAPHDYNERRSDLPEFIRLAPFMRGTSTVMRYNKMFPEQVWDTASRALA